MPGIVQQGPTTQHTCTSASPCPFPIHFRDGVHSAIILEFGLILAAMAIGMWLAYCRVVDKAGRVICPHCTQRYDNVDD